MDHITPPYEIARWIAAYLSKSLGSDEQMQLDCWRKASPSTTCKAKALAQWNAWQP